MVKRYLTDKDWMNYKKVLNDFFNNDIGLQPIIWLKHQDIPPEFGEDSNTFTKVETNGLLHYNYIKLWPYNQPNTTGSENNMYFAMYLSKSSLREQGHLINEYIDLNPEQDRFIINNQVYKPSGDSDLAQSKDEPLWVFIILIRVDKEESSKLIKQYT